MYLCSVIIKKIQNDPIAFIVISSPVFYYVNLKHTVGHKKRDEYFLIDNDESYLHEHSD